MKKRTILSAALAAVVLTSVSAAASAAKIDLPNGDFETDWDATGWTATGFTEASVKTYDGDTNTTQMLNLWLDDSGAATDCSVSYGVTLKAGKYSFKFSMAGSNEASGLSYKVLAGGAAVAAGDEITLTGDWNEWTEFETKEFDVLEECTVTFELSGTVPAGYWAHLDNLTLDGEETPAENPPAENPPAESTPDGEESKPDDTEKPNTNTGAAGIAAFGGAAILAAGAVIISKKRK